MDGVNASANGSVVTVTWNPLPENQWNGVPRGYFVSDSLCNTYCGVSNKPTDAQLNFTYNTTQTRHA